MFGLCFRTGMGGPKCRSIAVSMSASARPAESRIRPEPRREPPPSARSTGIFRSFRRSFTADFRPSVLGQSSSVRFTSFILTHGATERTRTSTLFRTSPSNWRVYQFRHGRMCLSADLHLPSLAHGAGWNKEYSGGCGRIRTYSALLALPLAYNELISPGNAHP